MPPRSDWNGDELILEFEGVSAMRDFFEDAHRSDGFLLSLTRNLPLFSRIVAQANTVDGFGFPLTLEVLQVFEARDSHNLDTAFRIVNPEAVPRSTLARLSTPNDGGGESSDFQTEGDVSPLFRIREMNPQERFRLSMRASRVERQILLRDSSPQVLMGLLGHPRIEDAEVLEIVKSNYASAGTIQRVADNRKWMQNREIQIAVVRSPKTPPIVAQRLLPLLPTEELRTLAKMGNARETLRKAALRVYLQRTRGGRSDDL